MRSMFIDQFAEHIGAGRVIESSPLRFSKRFNGIRIVPIHKHDVDDVTVLFMRVRTWFIAGISRLTRKPMICCVYQRNM